LEGFSLGHGTDLDGKTGLTVVLYPEGALAAAELRGSATGTRQIDSLISPHHLASRAHGVVLAGGSGFGLGAAGTVVEALEARGIGFHTGLRPVPIVPAAILFDLAFGDPRAVPGPALAWQALETQLGAGEEIPAGSVGAGTGATVGKVLGPALAMKGGFGFASLTATTGVTVAAAVAVNAFGDVRDPVSGRTLAGCRKEEGSLELAGCERVLASLPPDFANPWEGNTTLAVVMTDAALPRPALFKVCHMAFGGFHRALAPALSLYDGDVVMVLSSQRQAAHVNQVGLLAELAVGAAIVRAVEEADGFGLLPAARDLPSFEETP
jgi:L-aminopeptidase/D-esterase-like protein